MSNTNLNNHDAIMRKFDLESNTRIWTGRAKLFVKIISSLFSLFFIYATLFSVALPEVRLTRFIAFIIILGFIHYPVRKNHLRENHIPLYDIVLMVVGASSFLYFSFNALEIIKMTTRIQPLHVFIAIMGLLVLFELARRCVGLPILCVSSVLLIYAFFNQLSYGSSGIFQVLRSIAYKLFYTTNGVIGTPINVCYTYIVLFIIFGAFIERTGIAKFFISFANKIAGSSSGGPAKVAVISSALCGMVSGSSVGNTVTTGSITIPMMKETGYDPEFSGAVEASASTGGQIMPPIMGAAAFLMSEYMGISYYEVALKAILPAVLYFAGIFISVHLEAKRLGLKGVVPSTLSTWRRLFSKSFLLLPLVLLVLLVSSGLRTMQYSASVSILAAIIVGFLNKEERLTFKKIIEALEAGAKGAITVAVACSIAGIIAGCITITGLASVMINGIVRLAANAKILGLLLTMISCIILGMGVPTTANYCIMASTTAPILIYMGIPQVAAHFFVFYFGIVADITPPVALAAYAGSAIAKGNPMKTGIKATRLAIAAFIVPFIFAYNPSLLLIGNITFFKVAQMFITSLLGIFGISSALGGYVFRNNNVIERIIYAVGGLILIIPDTLTDIIGLIMLSCVFAYDYYVVKKRPQ